MTVFQRTCSRKRREGAHRLHTPSYFYILDCSSVTAYTSTNAGTTGRFFQDPKWWIATPSPPFVASRAAPHIAGRLVPGHPFRFVNRGQHIVEDPACSVMENPTDEQVCQVCAMIGVIA